uniref:Uncharacterized protein n=1 Tax=Oryza sativa subsp. japonica TaxID=39947 RepID=Q6YWJ6_ORYSJ|nr:unknown protein [Oryza sativa Japonica Group]
MMVLCHGSDRCCSRLSKGPFCVTLCCTRNPKNASIASLPVGELLLLGLEGGLEVEGVEDAAGVAALVRREAVALEDGVLVDAARVLDVLPPPDLHVVEQDELDDEQRRRRREVGGLAGVVPLRRVDQPDLRQHLRQQHPGHPQHRPPPVHQLRLHEPPQVLRVLRQTQRVEPVIAWQAVHTRLTIVLVVFL